MCIPLRRLFVAVVAIVTAVDTAAPAQAATVTPARCGVVQFRPYAAPRYSAGTAYEYVEATLSSDDRVPEKARFPYTWDYPDGERTDPWSSTNWRETGAIPVRRPPPGFDRTSLPPLIAFILAHTDRQGYSVIPGCPAKVDAAIADQRYIALDYELDADVAPDAHFVAVPWLRGVGRTPPQPSDVIEECASILNRGEQSARSLRLLFTYADHHGHTVATESLDATGPFVPNVAFGDPARAAEPDAARACRVFAEPRVVTRSMRQRITKITLSITHIEFADGSSWGAHLSAFTLVDHAGPVASVGADVPIAGPQNAWQHSAPYRDMNTERTP